MAKQSVVVPALDHDKMMKKRFGEVVRPQGVLERRIVANLIAHMETFGWKPYAVDDDDEATLVGDMKSAMELIFNLDDSLLTFIKDDTTHGVRLILGNGFDLISDWGYSEGDPDGFNAAMDTFNTEEYA